MSKERLNEIKSTSRKYKISELLGIFRRQLNNFIVFLKLPETNNIYVKNLIKRYIFCNKYIKNKIVLDIPCGSGWGTSLLKGYKELYGIDISKEAILEAKRKYPSLNFTTGKMQEIPFKNNFFDVVICLEGIEHITFLEGQKFLKEVNRVTKSNGLLIITTPLLIERKYHSGNKYHICEYKEEEFVNVIEYHNFSICYKDYLKTLNSKVLRIVVQKKETNKELKKRSYPLF